MKKIGFIGSFVYVIFLLSSCNSGSQKQDAVADGQHKDSVNLASYTFKTADGWGYAVTADNKVFIKQTIIPVVQGVKSFSTEDDANKVANLVISKIKAGKKPTITKEDLKALGIIQ